MLVTKVSRRYHLSVSQHVLRFANPITYMNAPSSSSLNPTRPHCSSLDLFCLACRPRTARCVRRRSSLSLPVRRPPAWESHRKRKKNSNPHKHTHTHKRAHAEANAWTRAHGERSSSGSSRWPKAAADIQQAEVRWLLELQPSVAHQPQSLPPPGCGNSLGLCRWVGRHVGMFVCLRIKRSEYKEEASNEKP